MYKHLMYTLLFRKGELASDGRTPHTRSEHTFEK